MLRSSARRPSSGAATPAPPVVGAALASAGTALPAAVRARFEGRLGHELGNVRVHDGATAAESARAVNALAYTVGEDVVFDTGRFAPETTLGQQLLLHELTHVVQGRRGVAATGSALMVAPADTAEEREAHTVANSGLGGSKRAALAGAPHRLRRFQSPEHVKIGDDALPGQTATILGYGSMPIGELIAIAGDFFESLQQIQDLAHQSAAGRAEIDCARQKVRSPGTTCADAAAEEAVSSRYEQLAARNWTHFSTGTLGHTNRDAYIDYHSRAITSAWLAGLSPLSVQPAMPEAIEGFGLHFLTDAFSAGHVRTPREQLRTDWNGRYPSFADNLISMIGCYIATWIYDEDQPTKAGIRLSRDTIWKGVHAVLFDVDGVEDAVRARAGSRLSTFGIGDVLSIAMHDADNAGLNVVSPQGPAGASGPVNWRAVGDSYLFRQNADPNTAAAATKTVQMVESATRMSFAEITAAYAAGKQQQPKPSLDPATFSALKLFPAADPASTSNPAYTASAAAGIRSLPALTRSIITAEFAPSGQIRGQLGAFSIPDCQSGMHAGSGWRCFLRTLVADPFEMLARACEGTVCPPGNANPCTSPREPRVPATC